MPACPPPTWQAHRRGQGARTDPTYFPDPDGHPVFVNAVTIATATLLRDLADSHNMTIPRPALPKRWAQQFSGTITPHHYSNLQSSDYPTNHQSAHHLDQTQRNPARRSPHHHH